MSGSLAPSKQALRPVFKQRRRALLPAAEAAIQRQAVLEIAALLSPGDWLGLYWPLRGEVDLRMLAQQPVLQQRLALPRAHGQQLSYHPWQPGDPLSADASGIPAPSTTTALDPAQLTLLLVPALALDQRGIRLGYGGGWFDRLRSQPAWQAIPAVAVLPSGCIVEELPADPWDVPFTAWLDEQGLHWLQAM